MDVLSVKQRSYCMSRIRGRNTKPELALRRAVWDAGLRYRVNNALVGRPDFIFASARVAVFVDGCFWHGCPQHAVKSKTRASFWAKKMAQNLARDVYVNVELKRQGWTVLRFWEHDIDKRLPRLLSRIERKVKRGLLIQHAFRTSCAAHPQKSRIIERFDQFAQDN